MFEASIITHSLNIAAAHPSWQPILKKALDHVDRSYLRALAENNDWLPGPEKIFNAFSIPVDQIKFILLGESPYPRKLSANGYAFWDAAVQELWNTTGLSKPVNRATSLRHLIKTMLVAEGVLQKKHTTQEAIAQLDKSSFVKTNDELFQNFLRKGFLLLNASLVLQKTPVKLDAKAWAPFIRYIINFLLKHNPDIELILFGKIAQVIGPMLDPHIKVKKLVVEHPYNISFIGNDEVIDFFKRVHLLKK